MRASPEAQLRLLELTELDAELSRLDYRRRGLPEHQELEQLQQRDAELRDTIATLDAQERDARREQGKAEADVDQVRSRIVRDQERLDAGQVHSPRELENLQSEIGSLLRRQSDLEEIVLEVMQRRETAEGNHDLAVGERAKIATEVTAATARRDAVLEELDEQAAKAEDRRAAVAAEQPPNLLTLYEKLRVQHDGVGAAMLRRGRCEGCHLSLNTVDLNSIRAADPDEVLRCEECRRILIRSDDSGL